MRKCYLLKLKFIRFLINFRFQINHFINVRCKLDSRELISFFKYKKNMAPVAPLSHFKLF